MEGRLLTPFTLGALAVIVLALTWVDVMTGLYVQELDSCDAEVEEKKMEQTHTPVAFNTVVKCTAVLT